MRTIHALAVSILLLGASGLAEAKRPTPVADGERTVVQVFDAAGHTRDEIFSASKMWIAENFRSAKAVVEYEDRGEGTIVGNGVIAYPCTGGFACRIRADAWSVGFTMKVESKDDRFRLTFTNVVLKLPSSAYGPAHDEPVEWKEDMDNIRAKLLEFGPQIVAQLSEAQTSSDW